MIKKTAGVFAVLTVATLTASASAQDFQALRQASIDVYNTCAIASETSNAIDPTCACIAGYYGGALTDREFEIVGHLGRIGVLVESGASEDAVNAEIGNFFAAGFTQAEADAASAKMNAVTLRGATICSPYEESNATS